MARANCIGKEYREHLKKISADRMHEALRDNGLSQTNLSKITGVPLNSINVICSGKRSMTVDMANRISSTLGVADAWLMGISDKKYDD